MSSNTADDGRLAPPRPLTGPNSGSSGVKLSEYSGTPSEYSLTDAPTQPAMPPLPQAQPATQTTRQADARTDAATDKKADKAARKAESKRPRTVRRAKLRVVRLDPWSVTKASFLLSIAFGIMCVVAVFLVMSIITASGLWGHINDTVQGFTDRKSKSDQFDITDYVGMSRVMGITMLISAVDVVIITALATLGAFIYNMAASLLGGVEVTLAEDLR